MSYGTGLWIEVYTAAAVTTAWLLETSGRWLLEDGSGYWIQE